MDIIKELHGDEGYNDENEGIVIVLRRVQNEIYGFIMLILI